MTLTDALQLESETPTFISFCGGGGKTSSIFTLAKELKAIGKSVLVATTTKIFIPLLEEYDQLIISEQISKLPPPSPTGHITVLGPRIVFQKSKLDSITFETLHEIRKQRLFQYILIEADGAQCKPLKAPAEHEPVIYPFTDIMIGVTGFDSYQQSLTEAWVHRPNILSKITAQKSGEKITKETYSALLQSPLGLFKNAPEKAKKIWILNKVDRQDQLDKALEVAYYVKKENENIDRILITCLKHQNYLKHILN